MVGYHVKRMADEERIDFGILLGLAYARFVDELHAALARRASTTSDARTGTSSAALDGAELNAVGARRAAAASPARAPSS